MNKNIVKIAGLIIAAFLVNIGYLTYLQVFQADKFLNHPRNRRLQILEETVIRGKIIDSRENILAETTIENGRNRRIYPFVDITAHITGYESNRYGRTGLEASYNGSLLGFTRDFVDSDFWSLKKFQTSHRGNDLILSIDISLQKLAYQKLGKRKGAVVAIEPATGRVLAMVSKPDYNPELLEAEWQRLSTDPESPLLNRAAQGLYAPGSTFKVITAAGILKQNPETINQIFDAPGYVIVEGRRIEDQQAQGKLNFTQAFALSSNYVFATLGIQIGADRLAGMANSFLINNKVPFDLEVSTGRFPLPQSKLELAEAAIGQGRILATPLNMALTAAAIANRGAIMSPRLVDEIRSPGGSVIWESEPRVLANAVSEDTASLIRDMMIASVDRGTGTRAAIPGIRVAGKTGTAENPHGIPHAWFIGFAPANDPKVAVAVIIENGGTGGREAAPVAGEIMKAVIKTKG